MDPGLSSVGMRISNIFGIMAPLAVPNRFYERTVNMDKSYDNTRVSCLVGSLGSGLTVIQESSKVDVEALDRLLDQLEDAEPPLRAAITIQLVDGDVPEYVELFKALEERLELLARSDKKLPTRLKFWGVYDDCAHDIAQLVGQVFPDRSEQLEKESLVKTDCDSLFYSLQRNQRYSAIAGSYGQCKIRAAQDGPYLGRHIIEAHWYGSRTKPHDTMRVCAGDQHCEFVRA